MEKIICDVAIIGAGPAGLAAAVETASRGLSVAVFEKSGKAGGLRDGGIGPFAVESFVQERSFVNLTKEDAFNYMMEFTHWTTDACLVSEYINISASTIDWLSDFGMEFQSVSAYYKGGMPTQHNFDHKRNNITETLYEKAIELGASFLFETTALHIVKEDGRVTGLSVADKSGSPIEVRSKAVVVACGGFGGNDEMVATQGYTKNKDLFYTFEMPDASGDGLRMVWEAGGARAPMMMDVYIGLARGYGGPLGTAPALAALRQPKNLMVNQKGRRFVREDLSGNPGYMGNAVHRQINGCAVMLLDEGIYREFQESESKRPSMPPMEPGDSNRKPEPFERFNGRDMDDILEEAIASGNKDFFIADSLAEFAEQAGIPLEALIETVSEYNQICSNKEDTVFHKNPRYLKPLNGPRYYGARFYCDTYGGLGGIRINHKAEVLDMNEDPVPGLYAAGNDVNTIYGGSYPFYLCGNTSSFALNTGRIAGKSICNALK